MPLFPPLSSRNRAVTHSPRAPLRSSYHAKLSSPQIATHTQSPLPFIKHNRGLLSPQSSALARDRQPSSNLLRNTAHAPLCNLLTPSTSGAATLRPCHLIPALVFKRAAAPCFFPTAQTPLPKAPFPLLSGRAKQQQVAAVAVCSLPALPHSPLAASPSRINHPANPNPLQPIHREIRRPFVGIFELQTDLDCLSLKNSNTFFR